MGQKTQAVSITGNLALGSAWTGSVVFTGNDSKRVTLPSLDGQPALASAGAWAGAPYELVNGGPGLITLQTAPGQYFNRSTSRAVAGVTSLAILPYATLSLRAHHDGKVSFWEVISLSPPQQTFSAAGVPLPACVAALAGQSAIVTDATAPSYNGLYQAGGTVQVPVYCDGNRWTTH